MVIKDNPLSGEERKIVSTRLYQSEFLYLKKACAQEGKSINSKLRELIREEIQKNPSLTMTLLEKKKTDEERAGEKLKTRFKVEIKNGL